jgi:type I restriction enzyme S subunit
MSWNKIKFKKFITLQRGFDLPITEMKDGKIPVLGSTCIVGYHDKAKVKPPGVITGRSGTIGVVQYIDKPYWPHNTSLWIKDFKLNYPKFVYYKMKTLNFNRFNGGASVPTLNRNNLDNLIVLIPDIKTQKKIAEILSTYDDLIDVNSWRIEFLEESARLLFREWFVYFRFPGHEKVKIVDRDGRKMPVEWDYLPFTKIKIFKKAPLGVPVFTDARQYYQTSEINSTTIIGDGVEVDYENRPSRANIAPTISTVYFAKMKDTDKVLYFNRGNSFLLEKILLSTGMVGFATDKKYLGFLFSLLKSYEFVKYKNNFATGATQVSLNNASLKKIKVLFPTQNLVELYSEIVNPLLEECSYLRCQNQKLGQARDLLLPRLMNGTINVSELNTKIPEEAEI